MEAVSRRAWTVSTRISSTPVTTENKMAMESIWALNVHSLAFVASFRPQKTNKQTNKQTNKKQKNKNCFYGRTDLPSRVGRAFFFLISGSKIDPKNTNILKRIWHFLHKNFGKIFWLIFKNFQLKCLDFGQIYIKKNYLPKWKIWVGRTHKTGVFLWPYLVQELPTCMQQNTRSQRTFWKNTAYWNKSVKFKAKYIHRF